ncbi:hypothetical protein BT63DRAFT_427867 [Microthyrium microscopicum]|uniref:F-box domain-containing protein n=1 Tax=Microthyrium microscopicum TaxID=703497 RepID=A0A6A6U4L2_9PEZI|nr:hypothetical protein BT63DRAFT_427867 [Microthyrium microscopicum]
MQQYHPQYNQPRDRSLSPIPRPKDFTLDDNLPVLNPRVRRAPVANLGALESLPLELLQIVFTPLDLHSLSSFRRVNRRALHMIEALPDYHAIKIYALSALRGIAMLGLDSTITLSTLYQKLCTAKCEECGDFAGYLYLLTCKRVCFLCFSRNEKYLPLLKSHAVRKFGITNKMINSLPHFKSVPGRYSTRGLKVAKPITLVDYESAYQAGLAHLGDSRLKSHMRHAAIHEDPTRDLGDSNPNRFMAISRTPWYNAVLEKVDPGFHCVGCESMDNDRPFHWRVKYDDKLFNEHTRAFGKIRKGNHWPE